MVARFLLGHIPAKRAMIRRINHNPRLRILRPLLDPHFLDFDGDTLDELDFKPLRGPSQVRSTSPPGVGPSEKEPNLGDERDYADGGWARNLLRMAHGKTGRPGRSLLGRPLP